MFHKDTFRLIKKTFNRFFSLVMIVFIGVAFMMGLMSTSTIMRTSMDRYADNCQLQDLQLYSSYGFDEEDVEYLKKIDYITSVFPSKMTDVYSQNRYGDVAVMRLEEADRANNHFDIIQGRLPEKENELLLLSTSLIPTRYAIGDTLTFYLENGDVEDSLARTEFEIVGFAMSASYTSKVLGPSNCDNQDLSFVAYVTDDVFISDYYTTIYLTIEGASDQLGYIDSYYDHIQPYKEDMEFLADAQQDHLKEKLLEDYRKEIEDEKIELEENREKYQKELDDAKKKLDDGNIQLVYAQLQIDTNESTLVSGEKELETAKKLLAENEKLVNDSIRELENEQGASLDEIYSELTLAYNTYQSIKAMKDMDVDQTVNDVVQTLTENNNSLKEERERLNKENIDRTKEKEDKQDRILEIDATLLTLEAEINVCEDETAKAELILQKDSLLEEKNTLNNEIDTLNTESDLAQNRITTINNLIASNEITIMQLNQMDKDSYYSNLDTLMKEINDSANGDIEKSYADLTLLVNSRKQIEDGKKQIEENQQKLIDGRKQLEEGREAVEKSRREYEKGLKEYEDGVREFEKEMEEAENKLRKAQQDLDELPDAKWMVLDRSMHYSSYMYENTCSQMGAIGFSLPFLFYLVAALVCMTTMTRLIDEQRGQIGIYRALGFSKGQVISKYVIYALLASLSGSVFGIFAGMALFPTVIYETWRLMYVLPDMVMVYPLWILLICILAFSLLMMGVTFVVINNSLKENPAQLMRPKAPKNAKKVFLEKIHFIWNKLSFTSKITARNLIRYKSRFFMTVIGVAGCTGLLVVGWGVKDSISDIINIQYGEIFNYDYSVNVENDTEISDMISVMEKDLGNEYIVPFMSYSSRVYVSEKEPTITVQILDARSSNDILNLRDKDGKTRIKLNNTGVILSEKFAKTNKIKEGDLITIESKNGIKAQVKVSHICELYFQHYCFISESYYQQIFDEKIHYTTIAVCSDSYENLKSSLEGFETFTSLTDFSSMIANFQTMIEALDIIILVIIITAGSLALVVLINLTQVNISERIREIATLKVLGFRDNEVNSYIFKEIFLLTVIGAFLGLPLGVVEHHFIMGVIDMEMVMFGSTIRPLSFLYAYLITMVFTLLVLFFTRKPLQKIEMIESLKSVE